MSSSSALDQARADLDAASVRQEKIDRLIVEQQHILDQLEAERKNKGRGRPNTAHAAKKKAAESKNSRLQRGILPGESVQITPRTASELRQSAAQHPQHHAAADHVPLGRAPSGRAAAPAAARQNNDGDGDDEDAGDEDDDEEDESFSHYYKVSAAQKAFNEDVSHSYLHGDILNSEIKVEPDNLLSNRCKQESDHELSAMSHQSSVMS